MGYGMGWDAKHQRFIGYAVLAFCDHPDCNEEIDRGLAHLCASEDLYGGEDGCGMAFCSAHHFYVNEEMSQACQRCRDEQPPFPQKPEHPKWINHLLTDKSWAKWRSQNSHEVTATRKAAKALSSTTLVGELPHDAEPTA